MKLAKGPQNVRYKTNMHLVCICNDFSSQFQSNNQLFTQNMGFKLRYLSMGSRLPPFLAAFYAESFEASALKAFSLKHRFWGLFVGDVISVWNHWKTSLYTFLRQLNVLGSALQFTLELVDNCKLAFLDVLISKKSLILEFPIYRKTTHNDRYLRFSSTILLV